MPTLLFADLEALRLTLTSGVLPAEVVSAPARAGFDARGRLWLNPAAELPDDAVAALAPLGVPVLGDEPDAVLEPVADWLRLLPLQPAPLPDDPHTSILFELTPAEFPRLAVEVRRLSPTSGLELRMQDWWNANATVLVRGIGVPRHTLLRGGDERRTAFWEQAPNVWVEVGFRYPLAEQIRPEEGTLTLIRAPGRWSEHEDYPRVREFPSFPLPRTSRVRRDAPPVGSIELPLRLNDGGPTEPAELWVIHDRPDDQLADLVRESGPALLSRLRVAVVRANDRSMILLHVEPSKRPPPVVTVAGIGCRPYLKLPNLFVPCGMRFSPPARRDVVRAAFAVDPATFTVLLPDGDGRFVPVAVPADSFAPLEQSLEYDAPRPHPYSPVMLQRVMEYEPFEEVESVGPAEEANPAPESVPAVPPPARKPRPGWLARLMRRASRPRRVPPEPRRRVSDAVRTALPEPPPSSGGSARKHELTDRRTALEAAILQPSGADATAVRRKALPELAALHTQLGNHADAAVCWLNALWDHPDPPPYMFWGWLQAEKKYGRVFFPEDELTPLLDAPPTPYTVRALAAWTVWLARQRPPVLDPRTRPMLEAHEGWLPVRAAWLAQLALAGAAGGDVLALARARDRLNERLYHHGLSLEADVPAFLRFAGSEAGERFRAVRAWLELVRDPVHRWADHLTRHRPPDYVRAAGDYPDADGRNTKSILELMLAWGLARLGEQTHARLQAAPAAAFLRKSGDPALAWIGSALEFRVGQALDGKPPSGAFPPDLLADAARLTAYDRGERDLLARYQIDTLRAHSRILEPAWPVNPFGPPDDRDPAALVAAARHVLDEAAYCDGAGRLLERALDEAGRRGGAVVADTLADVQAVAERLTDPLAEILLLEKTLALTVVRSDGDAVAALLPRLERLFSPDGPRFPAVVERALAPGPRGPADLRRLEGLPGLALRSLRRLGLADAANRLELPAVEWVLGRTGLGQLRSTQPVSWPAALRAVLHIAGNWFGGRHEERAVTVLDAARQALFYAAELTAPDRLALAQAYAAAVSHAHPRVAQGRVEELFRDLFNLYDLRLTNTHYALPPLALVDAVVRAAVSDEFALGPAARRWLDEDEFVVRSRMTRDAAAWKPG